MYNYISQWHTVCNYLQFNIKNLMETTIIMITALLVSQEKKVFKTLEAGFADNNISTEWVSSGQDALSLLTSKKFDLFITNEKLPDMKAKQLIEKALFQNAMMNSVVLSQLSHKDFHEAYEGLGVLMQFPLKPETEHIQNLIEHLERIDRITKQTNSLKGE